MAFNVRAFGYSGVLKIPIVNPRQESADSLFVLRQPYEFSALVASNGSTPVMIGPTGLPPWRDLSTILRVEIPDGQAIRFELNPPGRSVTASANSPTLSGILQINWGAGWSMSFIEVAQVFTLDRSLLGGPDVLA